jgi:hypothetical protein
MKEDEIDGSPGPNREEKKDVKTKLEKNGGGGGVVYCIQLSRGKEQ